MPWKIYREEDEFVVRNIHTGKVMGKHPSRRRAIAQLRALHANVPDVQNKEYLGFEKLVNDLYEIAFKYKKRKWRPWHKPPGNIEGLAKHMAHKYVGVLHDFTACYNDEELADYPDKIRGAICAKVHFINTGHWPGEHGGANPEGYEPETLIKKRVPG